jgi:hypothetical protein
MPITTGSFAKLLWPGVNKVYGREYPKYPEQWRDLYDIETSAKHYEEDVGVSSFGLVPIKDEGGSIDYDTEFQGFTTRYVHTTYGLGFVVTREMWEDNQYNEVSFRNAKNLAFSVATTMNTLGAAVYNNSTTYTGGDGVALLSNTHVNASGYASNVDNLSASTLSEAALEDATIALSKFTNDRGLRIAAKPVCLIVPPDLQFTAHRILNSVYRVATANNDANAMNDMGTIPQVKVNNYITGTTSWYLRTNIPDGMKMFERRSPEFTTDNDFDTENAKFKTTFRCSWGWTDWRGLYGYDV